MYMLLKYNQILTEGEGQCTGLHAVCSKPDTSCVLIIISYFKEEEEGSRERQKKYIYFERDI